MIQTSNFSGNDELNSLLRGSSRLLAILLVGLICFGSIGCCGPMGCGPGCVEHCYDCDGANGRPIPMGPFQGLRNFKQQLTCGGGGCGEVYVGEWISTPPDCNDPCCGTQFVGGAVPSRPFCWAPGSLIQSLRISGRFDGCGDCGCDSGGCGGCDSCGGESFIEEGVSPVYESPVQNVAPSGCSTCSQGRMSSTQMARTGRVQNRPVSSGSMQNSQMARASSTGSTVRQPAQPRQMQSSQRMASTAPAPPRTAQSNVRTGNSRNRVANDPQVDRIRR